MSLAMRWRVRQLLLLLAVCASHGARAASLVASSYSKVAHSGASGNDPTASNCSTCHVDQPYVVYYPVEAGVTVTSESATTTTTTSAPQTADDPSHGRSYSSLRKKLTPQAVYSPVYRGPYNYGSYGPVAQDRYHPGHLNLKNKYKSEGSKTKDDGGNGGNGGGGGDSGGGKGTGGSQPSFQSAGYDYSFPPYSPPASSADTKPDDSSAAAPAPAPMDTDDFKPSIYYGGQSSYESDKPNDSYLPQGDSYGPPSDDGHPPDNHDEYYYPPDGDHHSYDHEHDSYDHDFDEHMPPGDDSQKDAKPPSDMNDMSMMKPDGMDDSAGAKDKPQGPVHDYYSYPYSYSYYHQDSDSDDASHQQPPPPPPKQKPSKSPPKVSAPPPPPPPPPEYYPSYKPKGKPDDHKPPAGHDDDDDDDQDDQDHDEPPSHKPDDSDSSDMAPPAPPHDYYLPYKPKHKPSYKPDETYYLPDDDEDDHHHHDHDQEEEHHMDEEEMHKDEDSRVSKRPYSYYNIGRKLWYVPLYFSVYFIIYVAALILKSVARHKIQYPLHHWKERREMSDTIEKDIDSAKQKYM